MRPVDRNARPLLRRSRGERRVTYALKILALVTLSAIALSAVLDFIGRVRSVAVIVIGAVFLTYIIHPAVRRLNAHLPLIWSILIVYLAIISIVLFGIAVVVPALYDDSQTLVRSLPALIRNEQAFVTDPHNPIVAHLPPPVRTYLATVPPQLVRLAEGYAGMAAGGVLSILLSVFGLLATLVVIPVITVYLMLEAPGLIERCVYAIPERARPGAVSLLHGIDGVLGGFIRGQLLVGATIGTCITIALLILRVKYAVLIGVAAGLFDIIPYVGAIVGFVPSVLLALVNQGWQHAALVAVVFALIFQAEGHFISPKIVSDTVGLSPLTVIVAILIGADLLGIAGMFLAVPIAGVLRVILVHAVPALLGPPSPPAPPAGELPATVPPRARVGAKTR
jgi:predicted PurR-regulated permease PerM